MYGHNRMVYNEEADALAKAWAAMSKVHRLRRVRDRPIHRPPDENKLAVERQAAVQLPDDSTGSDRPTHMRHKRREMRNAPFDIPDLEPD